MLTKADRKVRDQAIRRNLALEERRGVTHPLLIGKGSVVIGSIYDCDRKHFERLLKAYWSKLYVGWNPFKNEGNGCWEVWQEPLHKIPQYQGKWEGEKFWSYEYVPNDFEHWVADLQYLSYDFIERLKQMDSWENKHQVADHDYEYDKQLEKAEKAEEDNIKYVVRHNKQIFRDLLDYTQAGYDPVQFFHKSNK